MTGDSFAAQPPGGSQPGIFEPAPDCHLILADSIRGQSVNRSGVLIGWLTALVLLTYCMLFAFLRHIPNIALGAAVGAALLLVAQSKRSYDTFTLPLLGVSIVYLILSYTCLLYTSPSPRD